MRKSIRKALYAGIIVAALLIVGVVALSIDREYQRTTDFGGGVKLIETVHVYRSPVTTIADSGGSATIPLPYRSEAVIHQKILRNGAVFWEALQGKTYTASVSPDRHYLVIWDHVHAEWWHVLDLSTGSDLEVHLPQHPGMGDGMVPLRFGRWSSDSHSILIALDGEEVEKPNAWMLYRETYLLDPTNGNFSKLEHCHQPYPEGENPYLRMNWDNTPCAGKFEE